MPMGAPNPMQPGYPQQAAGWVAGARNLMTRLAAAVLRQKEQNETPKYTPTDDEAHVLKLLDEPKRVRSRMLDELGPTWERNILYAAGIQHLVYDSARKGYKKRQVQEWMPLPVENHIQVKVQRTVDFFTRNRPEGEVTPNSTRQHDIDGAEIAEKVRRHAWDLNGEDDNLDLAANWLIITGNVWAKDWLDTTRRAALRLPRYQEIDEPVMDPQTGQPILGMDGQPVMRKAVVEERDPTTGQCLYDERPQGEVRRTILGPHAVTVPFAHEGSAQIAPWILEAGLYKLEELRDLYPQMADYIGDKGAAVTSELLHHHRIGSAVSQGITGAVRALDPYVLEGYGVVYMLERAPDRDFPKGLFIVEYSGMPLYIGDLALAGAQFGGQFSYEHCGHYRVPGQFWHRSLVDDAVGPQDGINRLEQALQMNDFHNGNPTWIIPKSCKIEDGAISNRPGINQTYDDSVVGAKPERIPGMPMPDATDRKERYVATMKETTGVKDVLTGETPEGVEAFVAINALGEDAEATFEPVTKRWDRFIERVETKRLEIVQRFYTDQRMLSIVGEDGTLEEIKDFRGAQLRGNTRFRVQPGSSKPRSKAGQAATLLAADERGFLEDVKADPSRLPELRERLGITGLKSARDLDRENARRENERLTRTVGWDQVHREFGDDDVIHHAEHTLFMKTQEFRRLPLTIQLRVVKHDNEHLEAIKLYGNASGGTLVSEGEDEPMGGPSEPEPGSSQQTEGRAAQ
jgi:hypothetical protein